MVHRDDWNDNSTPTYIRGKKKKILRNSANYTVDRKHLLTFCKHAIPIYGGEMIALVLPYEQLICYIKNRVPFVSHYLCPYASSSVLSLENCPDRLFAYLCTFLLSY